MERLLTLVKHMSQNTAETELDELSNTLWFNLRIEIQRNICNINMVKSGHTYGRINIGEQDE